MQEPLQRHPLSASWDDMATEDRPDFAASIARNGVREAIILCRDQADAEVKVLEGWHRYGAATSAGLTLNDIPHKMFEGSPEDAYQLVLDHNHHRKHLTQMQRAESVVRMRRWVEGGAAHPAHEDRRGQNLRKPPLPDPEQAPPEPPPPSAAEFDDKIAEDASVSPTTAQRARRNVERADSGQPAPPPHPAPATRPTCHERLELAQSRIAELERSELLLEQKVESQDQQIETLKGKRAGDSDVLEAWETVNNLQGELDVTNRQLGECQQKHADARNECAGLRRKLKPFEKL